MKMLSLIWLCLSILVVLFLSGCEGPSTHISIDAQPDEVLNPTKVPFVDLIPSHQSRIQTPIPKWPSGLSRLDLGEIGYISDESGIAEVWLLDVSTGFRIRLTESMCPSDSKVYGRFRPGVQYFSWSRDGSKIAYLTTCTYNGNSTLKVDNLETGVTVLITNNVDAYSYPSWDPSGNRLVFGRGQNNYGIYIVNLSNVNDPAGISIKRLDADCYGGCAFAVWSPDGKYIAYQGPYVHPANVVRVYISVITSSGQALSYKSPDGRLGQNPEWIHDISPNGLAWSNDSHNLAIATYKNYTAAYLRLIAMNDMTATIQPGFYLLQSLHDASSPFGPGFYSPTFSPDDKTLYFVSLSLSEKDPMEQFGVIYHVPVKNLPIQPEDIQTISPQDQTAGFLSLSRDGKWLVYAARTSLGTEIRLKAIDESFQAILVSDSALNTQPVWRPFNN